MSDTYPKVQQLVDSISLDFQNIFGENLLAIYITGSLSTNSYNEESSDIDLIVVLQEKVSENTLSALKDWSRIIIQNNQLASRLDASFVEKKNIRFDLQDDKEEALELFQGEISYAKNALGNSAVVWDQIIKNGITVFGVTPQEILTNVPWGSLNNAFKSEVSTMQERIDTHFGDLKFRYYVVTTLCRIVYTAKNKAYLSKEEALNWYKEKYGLHIEIIDAALSYIHMNQELIRKTQKEEYTIFADEVSTLLASI